MSSSQNQHPPVESDVNRQTSRPQSSRMVSIRPKKGITSIGIALMAVSLIFWPLLLLVPFLPLSGGAKVSLAGALVIVAEVMFWLGALLAGPAAARRMKTWWKRTPDSDEAP